MDKIILAFILLLLPLTSFAEDFSLHGFIQTNYSVRTANPNPENANQGNLIWGDERLQLKGSYYLANIGFFAKSDFYHDWYEEDFDIDFREGYVDLTGGNFGLRAGRQIFTWGVGDLLFINDVFPKDWNAFYSGRPLEYLKIGVDSIKLDLYSSIANVEAIAIPFFEPDNLPRSGRFHTGDMDADELSTTFDNTEYALRAYRYIGDFDVSMYLYKGFFRIPTAGFYPELKVYGLSAQRSAFGGVISAEYGYYDFDDSESRFLIGYQKGFSGDLTIGLQYYYEQLRDYITLRITKLLKYQTLKLSLFTFYSPDEEDFLIIPEVSYNFTDNLLGILGMNIFGGEKENTVFGRREKDDNIYVTVRYSF